MQKVLHRRQLTVGCGSRKRFLHCSFPKFCGLENNLFPLLNTSCRCRLRTLPGSGWTLSLYNQLRWPWNQQIGLWITRYFTVSPASKHDLRERNGSGEKDNTGWVSGGNEGSEWEPRTEAPDSELPCSSFQRLCVLPQRGPGIRLGGLRQRPAAPQAGLF